jgi:N-acetylmuramoyl-L-alanine amidase
MLARLIRAEAVGEGVFGMQLVGNVVINRVCAKCDEFKKLNTITKVINAKNAFSGIKSNLYKHGATAKERTYALRTITYWRADPANYALFYYAPGKGKSCKNKFYGKYAGKYKNHCFYNPTSIKKCGL